ncbi:MAG: phosphoribosylanthranilate isomerase [Flavobacteriales bacterium Tduv]
MFPCTLRISLNVKICGLRNKDNISEIATLQPEYVGFIFYPPSPRYVGDDFVAPDLKGIQKVGVFVNASKEEVSEKSIKNDLDLIQLHGQESSEYCRNLTRKGLTLVKAFGVNENFLFEQVKPYTEVCRYFLFDTKTTVQGGSGKKFNWNKLSEYDLKKKIFLSGGIGPEDAETIHTLSHPQLFAIDLNSRFEIRPGMKSIDNLDIFIKKIRS